MDAGTSTLHRSFHSGPSAAHGPGPSGSGSTPGMPEEQTHHKPFFYVQPQQPFLPVQSLQWPMPLAMPLNYNPYYGAGYPGFGYGLPMMPHFQPSPFMEAPGFVLPHTHLHLMDYRRMLNPQYYQSMAYHARRLRYQHHVPQRDVTSAEVQTEPFPAPQRSPKQSGSSNPRVSTAAASVQSEDRTMAMKELAPSSADATPPKGSFVIETEEVRIQCCATPRGLQVMHSNDTSEMFAQDVVHCSSIVQNGLPPEENSRTVSAEGNPHQPRQACPDILIVATPSGNDSKNLHAETSHSRIKMATNVDADFKVVRLPFDAEYLDELRKMESTVWSTEDTLVPSPDFLIESCDETLHAEVPSSETLVTNEGTAQEEVVPVVHVPKSIGEDLEDAVPVLENPADKMENEVLTRATVDAKCLRNLLLSDDSQMDGALQDTSFESLPAYLPSTSWLADFENASYCKMPATPQKLGKQTGNRGLDVPARRRKLDAEFKDAIRKPKERFKAMGKADRRSVSDHECCVSRSYNENSFVSFPLKAQRLCVRCSSKQRGYKPPSASPAQAPNRKFPPFQQRNDLILPTCDACKGHAGKRFAGKGSGPDVGMENEGESSENSGRRQKVMEEMKRPLAVKQNVGKCPATYAKLRERNCLCGELHQQQLQSKWQRIYHCPHGNAIREKDENRAMTLSPEPWRSKEQLYLPIRWQTEKSWRTLPGHNAESLKNDLIRAQNTNLHKKPLPPPQGIHRKDTRC